MLVQGTLESWPGKWFSPSNISDENIRPYSGVFLPGKKFGGHLGEGRVKLCLKGAFDFPLPELPLPELSPGHFAKVPSRWPFSDTFDFAQTELAPGNSPRGPLSEVLSLGQAQRGRTEHRKRARFFYYTVGRGISLQSQHEKLIWSW